MLISTKLMTVTDPEAPYSPVDASSIDPHFANVTLLLHAEGEGTLSSGIQVITQSTSSGLTLPCEKTGDIFVTNEDSPYPGNYSAKLDGTGDGLVLYPDQLSPAGIPLKEYYRLLYSWNITFWHKPTVTGKTMTVMTIQNPVTSSEGSNRHATITYSSSLGYGITLYRLTTSNSIQTYTFYQQSGAHNTLGWNYVFLQRNTESTSNSIDPYFILTVNGVKRQSSSSYNPTFAGGSSPVTLFWQDTMRLYIGRNSTTSGGLYGYLRDFKLNNVVNTPSPTFVPSQPVDGDYFQNGIPMTPILIPFGRSGGATDSSSKNNFVTGDLVEYNFYEYSDASPFQSFYFTGGSLSFPTNTSINFGTSDFTIEFWMKWETMGECYLITGGTSIITFTFFIRYASGQLQWGDLSPSGSGLYGRFWEPAVDSWYNIACSRKSGRMRIFINGTLFMNFVDTGNIPDAKCTIGGTDGLFLRGYMDEIRITKGVGRYDKSFVTRASPFPNQ